MMSTELEEGSLIELLLSLCAAPCRWSFICVVSIQIPEKPLVTSLFQPLLVNISGIIGI